MAITTPDEPGSNINLDGAFPTSIIEDVVAEEFEDTAFENRWTKTTAGSPTGPVDQTDMVAQKYTLTAAGDELILQSDKQPVRLVPGATAWFLWRMMLQVNGADQVEYVAGLCDTETSPFTNGFNDGVFFRLKADLDLKVCYARNATGVSDYVEGQTTFDAPFEMMTMLGAFIRCDAEIEGKMTIDYYINGAIVGHNVPFSDGPWDADLRLTVACKGKGLVTFERAGRGSSVEHLAAPFMSIA